jgi:glycolate oxidase FAD binding subunit
VKGGGRVVKNVAGYDFPRLLTGSLGTLGIISFVTVKVRPKPEATAIVTVAYENPQALADDLDRLNTSSTRPVALELLNGPASRQAGVGEGGVWTLAIGFEAGTSAIAWQVDRLALEVAGDVEALTDKETATAWDSLRELPSAEVGPVSIIAGVRPSEVVRLCRAIDPGIWLVQAHAGNGIVRAHAAIDDLDTIESDVHRLRSLAEGTGGYLTVARCPTDRKESFSVWGNPRADWAWSERLKAALDPGGVMNPGRFVGTI